MRVLHVIPSVSPVHGGPSRAVAEMERALAARGVHVTTATTDDDGPGRRMAVRCGEPIKTPYATRLYFPRTGEPYKVSLGLGRWLGKNIDAFDVVHAHAVFSFAPVAAALLARRRGVPYVLRPLGVLSPYGISSRRSWMKKLSLMLVERQLIEAAGAVHFTSVAEQAEAEALGITCRGVVIPLGIDTAGVSRADAGHRWSAPNILFLSRVDPKKNLEALLRAFALFLSQSPTATLNVAGTGRPSYVDELKVLARALGVADRVNWHGYVDGDRKTALMAAATVFVLASHSENFGIAVLEALAAGLPCIVSQGVALSGEIATAGAGIVAGTDPVGIAEAISAALSDRGRYQAMSVAARRLATDTFSMETMGARLEALYRDLATSREGRTAVAR
jgi:glycosyltransferase involved in cell wall biosynthesis